MGYTRNMRNMNKNDKLIQLCILMVLYIGISVLIAGGDIRKFKRSNGDVVFATIKSTSINSESHGTGRRRHTEITQTAEVEFTYNDETRTATVYKPFTKKVGDKLKLGITEDGRIFVLYMKFDLTFLIITGIFIVLMIVFLVKAVNQKEEAMKKQAQFTKSHDNVTEPYMIKFEDDIYENDDPRINQHEYDMRDMDKSMLKSELQAAAMVAQHANSSQYGNEKEEVDDVPKLKFELKQPLNHEKAPGKDE